MGDSMKAIDADGKSENDTPCKKPKHKKDSPIRELRGIRGG
jgi:hypothetical protein